MLCTMIVTDTDLPNAVAFKCHIFVGFLTVISIPVNYPIQ